MHRLQKVRLQKKTMNFTFGFRGDMFPPRVYVLKALQDASTLLQESPYNFMLLFNVPAYMWFVGLALISKIQSHLGGVALSSKTQSHFGGVAINVRGRYKANTGADILKYVASPNPCFV